MKADDYAKLLLDSSFKEAGNLWIRNTAFLTFQGLALGFFTSNLVGERPVFLYLIPLAVIGLAVSVLHLGVVRVSEHYNLIWFRALQSWVNEEANAPSHACSWAHLAGHLRNHEKLPWPRLHSSVLAKVLVIFIGLLWALGIATCITLYYFPKLDILRT